MNPEELAYMYCDQHVIKILLEICQMMYTAWFYSDQTEYVESNAPYTVNGSRRGYKAAHKKHPTTLWISSSIDNYNFVPPHKSPRLPVRLSDHADPPKFLVHSHTMHDRADQPRT